jgi:sedoheptulokinase
LAALIPRAVVYSPVGDNQAGFAGVLEPGGNEAVINIGTSAQLSVFCPRYVFSPKLETRPFPGGGFLRVYAALCGGWAYAYVARFFQQVLEQIGRVKLPLNEVFDRMQQYGTTTDSAGLRADTRFAGERNGPRPAGGVDGIGTTNFTPENLVRAVANGIATELAEAAQDMDLEGLQSLLVVGNAAQQNSLLLKALEKQFGLPCRLLGAGSEAALGAARLAARLGTHTSI